MMKRKLYEKPSMKVFKLKQKPQLLAGSGGGGLGSPSPFEPGVDPLNP